MKHLDETRQLHLAYRLFQTSQLNDAARVLTDILRANARNYHALHLLGLVETRRGDAAGLEYLKRSLAIDPPNLDFIENYAKTLFAAQRFQEAYDACEGGLKVSKGHASLAYIKALSACGLGLFDEGVRLLDGLLQRDPRNWQWLNDKAVALSSLGETEKSLECLDRAVAINPNFATAFNNRGNALKDLYRLPEALTNFERAIALQPNYAEAYCNRGNTFNEMGRFDEALADYDKSIALAPHVADPYYDKGRCRLALGDYAEGFRLLEYRMKMSRFAKAHPPFAEPLLRPGDDIDGKTVFIRKEFHLGDMLQFVRYAKLAADRGAHVVVAAQDALRPLLESLDPRVAIIAGDAKPERFDFHCPIMSLPFAFGTTATSIPYATRYLRAESDRVERWRERLGAEGFKVGVCWQGSKISMRDGRSFALAEFRALAQIGDVRLISLQKGDGVEQLADRPQDFSIEDFGDELDAGPGAFRDTAAIIESLDLVIAPDTALAHLAGALGRPAWVALKANPEWRWRAASDCTPWYSSLRLFRQPHPGDWNGVFAQIENALRETLESRNAVGGLATP